jgi:hypothetical protein
MKNKIFISLLLFNFLNASDNILKEEKQDIEIKKTISKIDFIEILLETYEILKSEKYNIDLYGLEHVYENEERKKVINKSNLNLTVLKDNISKLSSFTLKQEEKLKLHYIKNSIYSFYDYLEELHLLFELNVEEENVSLRKKILLKLKKEYVNVEILLKDYIQVIEKTNIEISNKNNIKKNNNIQLLKELTKSLDYKLFKFNNNIEQDKIKFIEKKDEIKKDIILINNFYINKDIKDISLKFENLFSEYIDCVKDYNKYKNDKETTQSELLFLENQIKINFGILNENINLYKDLLNE